MRVFENLGGKFLPRFKRDLKREERELAIAQSVCKQLLEEINHARHGYERAHLKHVNDELGKLIIVIREARIAAHHAHLSWKRFTEPLRDQTRHADELARTSEHEETKYLRFLDAIRTRLGRGEASYEELERVLALLRDYTGTMHESLLDAIRKIESSAYERAAYQPPMHLHHAQ